MQEPLAFKVHYDGQADLVLDGLNNAIARYKTGSYTGDGSTSLAVTGVGFKPRYVKIWERVTTNSIAASYNETTPEIIDDIAGGTSIGIDQNVSQQLRAYSNTIISLDADGFTVDDDGVDSHPNTSGQVYNYLAMG